MWARENPEKGGKVLAAIQKSTFRSRRPCGALQADDTLPGKPAKVQTDLDQQFANSQAEFADAAGEIGKSAISGGPGELEQAVNSMKQADDAMDLIARLPKASKTLLVFRPRPMGAFEKQVNTAVAKFSTISAPDAAAAVKLIRNIDQLGQVTADLSDSSISDVPSTVGCAPGADRPVPTIRNRWRVVMPAELVNAVAATGTVDDGKLHLLVAAEKLRDALKDAAGADAVLATAGEPQAWADWAVAPQDLKDLLATYQSAMGAAFQGFSDGQVEPIHQLLRQHDRFKPFLALASGVADRANDLATLPTGFIGEAQRSSRRRWISNRTTWSASRGMDCGCGVTSSRARMRTAQTRCLWGCRSDCSGSWGSGDFSLVRGCFNVGEAQLL